MSLKDEIEKLIQAEQQKLDIQGQEDKERLRRAEKRFRPLALKDAKWFCRCQRPNKIKTTFT